MALTTIASAIAAMPGRRIDGMKVISGTTNAGTWQSLFLATGNPVTGVAPSSGMAGDVPTLSTVGASPYINPPAGMTSYLSKWWSSASNGFQGTVVLYDRLWQQSGISATLTSAQTINSVALTRPDANGNQAEAWWEVYATMGAGTPTATLSYTNPAGTAAQAATSGAFTTALNKSATGIFQLASGDSGVKSIQSWTASATFTSGTIGLVIRRPISAFNSPSAANQYRIPVAHGDLFDACMNVIPDNACLEVLYMMANSQTNAPIPFGFNYIQG